jgi:hypothetical protein
MAWLSISNTGWPITLTRLAVVTALTVAQKGLPLLVKEQLITAPGWLLAATGWPIILTRGGVTGRRLTCPP